MLLPGEIKAEWWNRNMLITQESYNMWHLVRNYKYIRKRQNMRLLKEKGICEEIY